MKKLILTLTKNDFTVQTFKSGGKGGQHQNKTDSGVRLIHNESGISAESRSFRSQHRNKREALKRLVSNGKFQLWLNRKVFEIESKKTISQIVDEQMDERFLRIEYRQQNGKWEEACDG